MPDPVVEPADDAPDVPDSVDPAAAAPHDDVIALGHLRLRWPILAAAPMVGQSDPAYRALMRRWGATLVYTEMLDAARFADDPAYRAAALGRDGVAADDHPLVVQFAANEPEVLLAAGLAAQACGADAIDMCGCPRMNAVAPR